MNVGIESDDFIEDSIEIKKPTLEGVLSHISSGIGLDIAKNHSGVTIWNGSEVKRYGFSLDEYKKDNPHALYLMRKSLKSKLIELISNMKFEVCIIEDVYGGQNFDTVQKLVTLNTVIDELIFEGIITVEKFYRWKESRWLKYFRRIYKVGKSPRVKIETQKILEYLEDSFYLKYCGVSEAEKKKLFFEDICDATAMLCSVVMYMQFESCEVQRKISIKDIQFYYVERYDCYLGINDERIQEEENTYDADWCGSIEKSIMNAVHENEDRLYTLDIPCSKLGSFGIEHDFEHFRSGEGILFFYVK